MTRAQTEREADATDIRQQLVTLALDDAGDIQHVKQIARAAANEIERLRAELAAERTARAQAEQERDAIKDWFDEGGIAIQRQESVETCPYEAGTTAHDWWTRGFAHYARLFQSIEATKQRDRLAAALRAVEWVGCDYCAAFTEGADEDHCPWCHEPTTGGHAHDCPRQAALREVDGE